MIITKGGRMRKGCLFLGCILLLFTACDFSDNGEDIFSSFPIITEIEDTIPHQNSRVCELLLDRTDLINTVLFDTTYTVTEGYDVTTILYHNENDLPVCIFIAEVDISNSGLTIGTCTPDDGRTFKRQKISKQASFAEESRGIVWGGINADYFDISNGTPMGIVYKSGEAIKKNIYVKGRGWFACTNTDKALIGFDSEYPAEKDKFHDAVSGGIVLLKDGERLINQTDKMYPRSCIGVSSDSTTVYMLAVDGKRKNYSNGLYLRDAAEILKVLGANNALELDGGGSTTFIVRNDGDDYKNQFKVINHPSDNSGERPVANGLLVIQK